MFKRFVKLLGMYFVFRLLYQRRYRLLNWLLENETLRLFLIHTLSKFRW